MGPRHYSLVAACLLLAAASAACVDDERVTPPALDAAFLGYSDPAAKQTTCGNCHVGKQRTWEATGHAEAWADLQTSGNATATCNRPHHPNVPGSPAASMKSG